MAGVAAPPASEEAAVMPPTGARAPTWRVSWRSGPGSIRTSSIGRGQASSRPAFWTRTMRPNCITTAWLSEEITRKLLPNQTRPSSRVTK